MTGDQGAELTEVLDEGERLEGESEHLARARELLALPEGIHRAVPEATYHAKVLGVASKSALDLVLRSPARYRAWIDGAEKKRTAALSLGTAVHMARLEPERFASSYVIAPDFGDLRAVAGRTTKEEGKRNKETKAAWAKDHAGAVILPAGDGATTLGIVRSIAAHPTAGELFAEGVPEVTLIWRCRATGLLCKARVDYWLPELRIAVDLKTTTDARRPAFSRTIQDLGYHRQEAHYRDGFEALGEPIDTFLFVPVEKDPPFDLQVFELEEEDADAGRAEVLEARRTLLDCLALDVFPGYETGVKRIGRPGWARKLGP